MIEKRFVKNNIEYVARLFECEDVVEDAGETPFITVCTMKSDNIENPAFLIIDEGNLTEIFDNIDEDTID